MDTFLSFVPCASCLVSLSSLEFLVVVGGGVDEKSPADDQNIVWQTVSSDYWDHVPTWNTSAWNLIRAPINPLLVPLEPSVTSNISKSPSAEVGQRTYSKQFSLVALPPYELQIDIILFNNVNAMLYNF